MNYDNAVITLRKDGDEWFAARLEERRRALRVREAVEGGARAGISERELSRLAQCDRMTIRKILGKRNSPQN